MVKTAIYVRVSTHYQIDKDSLNVQKRELTAYAELILSSTENIIFEDAGYSAKNTDRPEFQRMMERIRTGEFTHLLVWKIDRISRNLLDFSNMYNELKSIGVTFVSKNEQFDTSTAIGEAMLKIILVFAELERKMTSERVTAVMLSRANNSQWNGGKIPFGYSYDKEKKEFSVCPEEAKIVRNIYEQYTRYKSVIQVVKNLNANGIKTRRSVKWSGTTVHKILTNPFYIGTYVYNVHSDGKGNRKHDESEWITIEDHHEPLISQDTFQNVHRQLTDNRKQIQRIYTRKHIHPFHGLVYCSECGSKMTVTIGRPDINGYRCSIYGCPKRRHEECKGSYVYDTQFGGTILNLIANIINANNEKPHSFEFFKKSIMKNLPISEIEGLEKLYELCGTSHTGFEYGIKEDNQYESLFQQRKIQENAMARLTHLYLYSDDPIPESEYIIRRKKIEDQIEDINTRLEKVRPESNFEEKALYFLTLQSFLGKQKIDYTSYIVKTDKLLLRTFLSKIIKRIDLQSDEIKSIIFSNGIELRFKY